MNQQQYTTLIIRRTLQQNNQLYQSSDQYSLQANIINNLIKYTPKSKKIKKYLKLKFLKYSNHKRKIAYYYFLEHINQNMQLRHIQSSYNLDFYLNFRNQFMKYTNRRNYQSSSYNNPKFAIQTFYSPKERDLYSENYTRRKSKLTKMSTDDIQTKFSQLFQSRRFRSKGSMMKTSYQHETLSRIRTQIREDYEKENQCRRIKQKPINCSIQPMKYQHSYRCITQKNTSDFLRYYKFSIGGHKGKPNQDRIFCGQNVYIVCDGHGPEGGSISSFVGQKLLDYSIANKHDKSVYQSSISKIFQNTENDLENELSIDLQTSGSTAILVQIFNNKIYCANAGDCRAIIGKKGSVIQLNNQHKPDKPKQRQRIYKMGGIIKKNGNGPYRIYNSKRKYGVGGLSVSRGFGDSALKQCGLTHQPQIMKFQINCGADFIIMGSDGFFQFFVPTEVINYTYKLLRNGYMNIAEQLVKQATRKWVGFYQTDDISCIVILF